MLDIFINSLSSNISQQIYENNRSSLLYFIKLRKGKCMKNQTLKMLKKKQFFLLSVFCVILLTTVYASATSLVPSCQKNEPNQFVLQGIGSKYKDVQISYSTTSITGKPVFSYKDSKGSGSFTGDEIRTQQTEMGTVATVTLESIPDLRVITLTILVPTINLDKSAKEFKTIAIRTTSKTSIGGEHLIKGAVQSYEVIDLKGTAKSVEF